MSVNLTAKPDASPKENVQCSKQLLQWLLNYWYDDEERKWIGGGGNVWRASTANDETVKVWEHFNWKQLNQFRKRFRHSFYDDRSLMYVAALVSGEISGRGRSTETDRN